MSKKNKQRFEFCVGTSNSHRSTIWKIVVNKSEIYIIPTFSKNYFKISLHGSGVCQLAITEEHLSEYNLSKEERPSQRWKCEIGDRNANIVFSLTFLNCFLVDFSDKEILNECVALITPPEDEKYTEILFYKVKATLPVDGYIPKEYKILSCFQLDNGELLLILYHYPVFSDQNKQVFVDGYRKAIAFKEQSNIKTKMVPGYLSTDCVNGYVRYIEIFV